MTSIYLITNDWRVYAAFLDKELAEAYVAKCDKALSLKVETVPISEDLSP